MTKHERFSAILMQERAAYWFEAARVALQNNQRNTAIDCQRRAASDAHAARCLMHM